MTNSDEFYIYSINIEGAMRRLASPLPSEFTNQHGLCNEATAGEFIDGDSPEHFTPNPEFVRFMQWALAKHAPAAPSFQSQAEKQPDGPTYIVDIRSIMQGKEPQQEDLIGVIMLEGGQPKEFKGSAGYKVLTENGFMRIEPWLHQKYLQELQEFVINKKA